VLLVYLVEEEKDIYIVVLVLVCHLGPVQLNPFSCIETADLYEHTPPRHSTATSLVSESDNYSRKPIPIYLIHIHRQAGPYRRTSPKGASPGYVPPGRAPTAAYTS
jgi:hypothetical protein